MAIGEVNMSNKLYTEEFKGEVLKQDISGYKFGTVTLQSPLIATELTTSDSQQPTDKTTVNRCKLLYLLMNIST